MRYFKSIVNGIIYTVGTGSGGVEITEDEYNEILSVIHDKPKATETTDYRLRDDLTWESYEIEPAPEPVPTVADKAEAFDILMGVSE